MNRKAFNNVFKSLSEFLRILSHPDRVKIIGLLIKSELDVHSLQEKLQISQSRVSQHLKLLKLNGLVNERREGKHVFYQVKDTHVSLVIQSAIKFHLLNIKDPQAIDLCKQLLAMWPTKEIQQN